ncbi:MAG: hypothetical protein ABSB49_09730 [Polyangia bacterium]|jgi:hypothetical protein
MRNVPRQKQPKERTATPEELAEERRRCIAARDEARLAAALASDELATATFAAWWDCSVCGSSTLVLDKVGPAPRAFACGLCESARQDLAKRLRKPSLATRILNALGFFASRGNAEALR